MTTKLHPFWYLKAPAIPPYTPEFYDGFETATLNKWTTNAYAKVTTEPVHHGTYAVTTINGDGLTYLLHAITPSVSKYFVRCMINFATPDVALYRVLLSIFAGGSTIGDVMTDTSGANVVLSLMTYDANVYLGTTPITAGWHCIILETSKGSGAVVNVWLDGVLEITVTTNNPVVNIDSFAIYLSWYGSQITEMDCIIGDITNPTCTYYPHLGV